MARCLRCGAGSEWLEGKVPENEAAARLKQAERILRDLLKRTIPRGTWKRAHNFMNPIDTQSDTAAEPK